ncbi:MULTISPECIES: sulfite exporter TauE/SafE family protein [Lactococcus]|uniref:Probable membrane transporter protein n=2 Tax=Lactococcus TaxID=1357 RepID=A0A387BJX6_9LACT|nr:MULTISPECIES: sulfite exporter TauE/SafE family protein [Lactococcus]AYG01347.1 sulfite exporter TauE/SafE family protein [Lactococcus allomyrinae]MCL2114053.1 sulfite exporter TauE/SafE family protein [Streptococcaceae bacterium]QDK70201.1 sulfite exporter TauE/SafE family protein [Lactococcus protaetiae]
MSLLVFTLSMLVLGFVAGTVGSILGLGGGIIITPIITTFFGVDIKYAIGASIVAVIATSSGAAISYLKDDMINIRAAMFLEIFTTIGGLVGAILAGFFDGTVLNVLFGCLLIFQGYNMWKKLHKGEEILQNVESDKIAKKLKLNSSYHDKQLGQDISYQVEKVPGGAAIMLGAGVASGLLGIGSGAFKVMAMDSMMKMPIKASTATSNLMIGVTAAASATVYFFNGYVNPTLAGPLAIGIVAGAALGSKIMPKLPAKTIRIIFIPVILLMAIQMLLKGIGVHIG